jgi:hypothetical protein
MTSLKQSLMYVYNYTNEKQLDGLCEEWKQGSNIYLKFSALCWSYTILSLNILHSILYFIKC